MRPLGVDEHSEALVEGKLVHFRLAGLLGPCGGHRVESHGFEFLIRWFYQHVLGLCGGLLSEKRTTCLLGIWLSEVSGLRTLNGCLSVVGGRWSVVAGRWLLVGGCWSVVAGRWLLVGGCWRSEERRVGKECRSRWS